jgi:hypothetical protein
VLVFFVLFFNNEKMVAGPMEWGKIALQRENWGKLKKLAFNIYIL